jgi:membrane protease YdiL (CAAX protease family)
MEELLNNIEPESQKLYHIINWVLLVGGLLTALLLGIQHCRNPPDRAALTGTIRSRALSFTEIYAIVLLHLTLFILAMFSGRLFYEHQIAIAKLSIALIIYSIVSFSIFANTWRRGDTLTTGFGLGFRQLKSAALAPLFYLSIVPLLLLSTAALKGLGYELPLQDSAQQFVDSDMLERVLFAMMAIIAAPFFEELLFRGVIFPALLKRLGLSYSIVLVSSLFALLHFHFFTFLILFGLASVFCLLFWHVQNRGVMLGTRLMIFVVLFFSAWITFVSGSFHSFLALMILSAALCLAYWRTGSLWVSIVMHMLFNMVSILALNIVG